MTKYISTGIDGLNNVLFGGFPEGAAILIEGAPGTGKTTLGFQYLYDGALHNEAGIYFTFEELPQQMYKYMLNFGWNLKDLEKRNLLRVISISPDVLLEQMEQLDGLYDCIVDEIQAKRIVIDSINLFEYGVNKNQYRKIIYRLLNILRRKNFTSLLLQEQRNASLIEIPLEHYLVDGIINLTIDKREPYRERILEVKKMRGTHIADGKHVYRMKENGIHLIPSFTIPEDKIIFGKNPTIPTGIAKLDQLLSGGITRSSIYLLEMDSKANLLSLFASLIHQQLQAGEKVILLLSNLITIESLLDMLLFFGFTIEGLAKSNQIYFISQYKENIPEALMPFVYDVSNMDNEQYLTFLLEVLVPIFEDDLKKGKKCFAYFNINSVIGKRGKDFFINILPELLAIERRFKLTLLMSLNTDEVDQKLTATVQGSSDGIIRIWNNGHYQMLQITKGINGRISEQLIIENIQEQPFIRLV